MEAIKIFHNDQFGQVRIALSESNEPLLCLADVCAILDLRQGDVKQRIEEGYISTQPLEPHGGVQQANFDRLFAWMREKGYLCQKGQYYNPPTQKAMDMGMFKIKKTSIARSDGSITVNTTTKATGKGQVYFVDRFLWNKIAS